MVERPETISDISLDKPGRPCPCVSYLTQRGVAAPAGTETVGAIGEGRLIVCLQQEADYFTDELVRPGRQAERSRFPILLGNMDPPYGLESVEFVARQPTPTAFTQDIQHCFGALHCAYLPALNVRSPGPRPPTLGEPNT